MNKGALLAAALAAVMLSGPAAADKDKYRPTYDRQRADHHDYRHDRYRPPARYRNQRGYRDGYEAGYRAAQRRCDSRYRYRRHSWLQDPRGDWYFSAGLERSAWDDGPLTPVVVVRR